MNKSKHTPGPWQIEGTEVWNNNTRVAKIVVDHPYHADLVDSDANAQLIAAAPEMLEALENLRDNFDYPSAAYEIILKAIAKAKGA